MLDRIKDLPPEIIGLSAVGKLSRQDYEQVFEPLVEAARREGRRLRLLYQFGPAFEGFSAGAAWEDARLGLRSIRVFGACAIVTDVDWIRRATKLARFMMPCPVRVFDNGELEQAVQWLKSLPEGPAASHRLIADKGVIVLEVTGPLRGEDFDALEQTADAWIDAHGHLRGLVVHAREFPGWEDLGSALRHVRFVRHHHRKVRRIALAVDGKLAGIAPRVADHVVHAEVTSFGYEELAKAIEWAAAP